MLLLRWWGSTTTTSASEALTELEVGLGACAGVSLLVGSVGAAVRLSALAARGWWALGATCGARTSGWLSTRLSAQRCWHDLRRQVEEVTQVLDAFIREVPDGPFKGFRESNIRKAG